MTLETPTVPTWRSCSGPGVSNVGCPVEDCEFTIKDLDGIGSSNSLLLPSGAARRSCE
jgi:hypothetical protein